MAKRVFSNYLVLGFLLTMLALLSACSSPSVQKNVDKPLFTDADVDAAPLREFAREDVQGLDDNSLSLSLDAEADNSSLSDSSGLTAQTVVPGLSVGGYVAYIVVDWNDADYPYQVWVHDLYNDSYYWVYGGMRQVDSVAVSSYLCEIGIIMTSEYDPYSWIDNGYQHDVYRIATDGCYGFGDGNYMERLTQSPADERQLSMDYSGYIWAWETDHLTNPNYSRGVLIRNFWSGRDLFLAHNSEQIHPSLSYTGDYVALLRQVGSRYDVYRFNVGRRSYTRFVQGVAGIPLSHPSITHDGSQVMFIQSDGNGDTIRTRVLGQGIRNQYRNCYGCVSHAYIEASGYYYMYNAYDGSSGYQHSYMRELSSGLVVDAGASNNAPYTDFLQSFWNP
ncbi:MAG: hypothetical protein R2880_21075 [Deinococcales bacterium]